MSIEGIKGNIVGIQRSLLERLRAILHTHIDSDLLLDPVIGEELISFTSGTGREVALFVDRRGKVIELVIGDASTVGLSNHDERRGKNRLSGVRCIHTHPGGNPHLSAVDLSALRQLRLDCMVVIGDSEPYFGSVAFLARVNQPEPVVDVIGPLNYLHLCSFPWLERVREFEKNKGFPGAVSTEAQIEKAYLIGLEDSSEEEPLTELSQLTETAGAAVVGFMTQKKERPDPATYFGSGKTRELVLALQITHADLLIVDDELTPAQQHRLERLTGIRVVDRTALILDIFAKRARTREGQWQVELAQLQYRLPRLKGQGLALSRQGGGIGTRGPGETQLETDRRHLRRRIAELERELTQVRFHRERLRNSRQRAEMPLVSMVGYTNAGKSTLSSKLVALYAPEGGTSPGGEDKLFATLDPTTRKIRIPGEIDFLLSDTVGFIRKLPHSVVKAFRATLEEVVASDLLVHVVDASHLEAVKQMETVEQVLKEIGVGDKPIVTVLNKMDKIVGGCVDPLLIPHGSWVAVSSHTGEGIDKLLSLISTILPKEWVGIDALIPYDQGNMLDHAYRSGKVLDVEYLAEGIRVRANIPKQLAGLWQSNGWGN